MQWRMMMSVGLGVAVTAGVYAGDRDELVEALRDEVTALRDEVAALRAENDPDRWLTERRAEEIRNLVADVLADAGTRASLIQDGATAGWDGSFYLGSADGNWLLRIKGQLAVRWVLSRQDSAPDGEDAVYGFEARRVKLKFQGHVVDPTWEYALNLAVDHDDGGRQGDLNLEDAIIRKRFGNGMAVQAGQYKLPFLFEENTSSSRQLAAERSLVNGFFNQDRSQGVMWSWSGDRFWLQLAYSDGFNSDNTAALFVPSGPGAAVPPVRGGANSFDARLDWLVTGDWKQFRDFTSPRGSAAALRIGAAVAYERDKYNSFGSAMAPLEFKAEFLTWTVDASLEGDGWNVFAYVVGRHWDSEGPGLAGLDQYGLVVQGGYFVTEAWEAFVRYEYGDSDFVAPAMPGATAVGEDLSILSLGANYYIRSHTLKWTTDVGVGLSPVSAEFAAPTGAGWRADAPGEEGQLVFRSQMQLLF